MTATVDIPLLPAQRAFIKDAIDGQRQHVCYRGGLGSGKTFIGVLAVIMLALSFPGSEWIIAAKSYPQLRDAVVPMFHRLMAEKFDALDYAYHRTDKTATMPNGSVVMFRSADAAISVKSTNPDGILFDEAGDWRRDDLMTFYGRARSTRAGMPRRLFTYNPGTGEFADMIEGWTRAGTGIEYVAPTTENIFLPDDYAKTLTETYGGKDAALVRRMVAGENVRFDGLVYPMFDRATHVIPAHEFRFAPNLERIAGIDFGYMTGHNFVYLMLAKRGEDWYVIAEHVATMMRLDEHAEKIKAIEAKFPCTGNERIRRYADHDAQDRAELAYKGIETIGANKEVMRGITNVTGLLAIKGNGRPNLYVLDTCPNTIREFGLYEWDLGAKDDRPRKDNDHCMDALRYAIHSYSPGGSIGIITGRRDEFTGRSGRAGIV